MAKREVIRTDKAPKPVGPYSQAIRAGGFVFCAGQVPVDPATGQTVGNTIETQTERALENLKGILKASGSSLDKVVRCTVYLKNMSDFAAMNKVYANYFPKDPPARSTIQAGALARDLMIEIDAIALA
ncbi:MAG: RidA family protein [Thaumarchaeota archaeon]|nr:RidA family protein [Nitrososphaerota archaeon]